MAAVRLFVGFVLTISFGLACGAAVTKLFWARPKSEFGEHLVTHASNST